MAESTLVKSCAACGTDCSNKPRTKDTKGNYFCKPCFDELLARKKRGEKIVLRHGGPATQPPASPDDGLDGLSIADDSPLTSLDLSASRSSAGLAPPPPVAVCPRCGAGLVAGAKLCVSCGTRLEGGGALRTSVAKAPRATSTGAARVIFGICGIIAGGLGVLIGLGCLVGAALVLGSTVLFALVFLAIGLLYLWLGGVHLLGAIDTLRRNAVGPQRMRLTAGVYFGVTVISAVAQAKLMSGDLSGGASTGELIGEAVVGVFIASIWPIAVLVWTSLGSTQEEIRSWK